MSALEEWAEHKDSPIDPELTLPQILQLNGAKADAAIEMLKCCFMCRYYDEGFCLWCATPSNGLATPTHPRCTTCRCTPSRWQERQP